jgi:hypothetical protein
MSLLLREEKTFIASEFTETIDAPSVRSLVQAVTATAGKNNRSPDVFLDLSKRIDTVLSFEDLFDIVEEINRIPIHNSFLIVAYVTKGMPFAFIKALQRAGLNESITVRIASGYDEAAALLKIPAENLRGP